MAWSARLLRIVHDRNGSTHGAGVTLLPFQAPCWLIGLRLFGGVADNHSLREDRAALSMDLFAGTR